MQKSVVVVGAGPSGLAAAKEMLAAGFKVTTVEMSDGVGGVFRLKNEQTYDNLYLTISNVFMSYSDYPMPTAARGEILYPNKETYGAYLNDYADHFKVRETIMFRTEVKKAALCDKSGMWNIVLKNLDSGMEKPVTADALLIATGCHATPKVPEFKGYTGKVRHAKEFKNAKDLGDKRVLVVGGNESASDVAAEVANDAGTAYGWVRQKPMSAPRFLKNFGEHHQENYDEFATLKAEKPGFVSDVLESIVITRFQNLLPAGIYALNRQLMWRATSHRLLSRWTAETSISNFFRGDQCQVPNKTDRLTHAVEIGKLNMIIAPKATCDGKKITFQGATFADFKDCKERDVTIEVDEIVCATGFQNSFPWLEADIEWNARAWYKHCFPTDPKLSTKLMFIGWCRPHAGGIPQCAEIVARYAAMVLKGERMLPKNIAELTVKERYDEDNYYVRSPQYDNLMDYVSYMESVADLIGCVPDEPNIITSPARWLKYWFFPNWPCYYRLNGPGADLKAAYKVIDGFSFLKNFWVPWPVIPIQIMLCIFFTLQMAINALLLMIPFNIKLNTPGVSGMYFKSKCTILHGNSLKSKYISKPFAFVGLCLIVGSLLFVYQEQLPVESMKQYIAPFEKYVPESFMSVINSTTCSWKTPSMLTSGIANTFKKS